MRSLVARIRLGLQRGLARADTWVAAAAIFLAGVNAGNDSWVLAAVLALVGVVFLVASGDYVYRKGFVAGRKAAGG